MNSEHKIQSSATEWTVPQYILHSIVRSDYSDIQHPFHSKNIALKSIFKKHNFCRFHKIECNHRNVVGNVTCVTQTQILVVQYIHIRSICNMI